MKLLILITAMLLAFGANAEAQSHTSTYEYSVGGDRYKTTITCTTYGSHTDCREYTHKQSTYDPSPEARALLQQDRERAARLQAPGRNPKWLIEKRARVQQRLPSVGVILTMKCADIAPTAKEEAECLDEIQWGNRDSQPQRAQSTPESNERVTKAPERTETGKN